MKKASIKGIEEMMKLLPPGWTLELITPNEKLRIVKPPLSPPQPGGGDPIPREPSPQGLHGDPGRGARRA